MRTPKNKVLYPKRAIQILILYIKSISICVLLGLPLIFAYFKYANKLDHLMNTRKKDKNYRQKYNRRKYQ